MLDSPQLLIAIVISMLERKRLHISPFNTELISIILPAAVLDRATNISFHTLQAFPERNYGYVDLPVIEADKVKKKFHGTILKGVKMHVEVAHPEKARNTFTEAVELEQDLSSKTKKKGKRKSVKADGVIPGFELPEGRKVKRGWTEPVVTAKGSKTSKLVADKGKKKSKTKSTFSDGPECLFKTKLPLNASVQEKLSSADGKARKRKRGETGRDVLVHEFSKTKKYATFLREAQGEIGKKSASEYIEGKGWVDENGEMMEPGPKTRQRRSAVKRSKLASREASSEESAAERTQDISNENAAIRTPDIGEESDAETSSSESSSSSADENEIGESFKESTKPAESLSHDANDIHSPIQSAMISQTESTFVTSTPIPEVHPLEALFKRPKMAASSTPKKPTLELSTSFTFFGDSSSTGEAGAGADSSSFLMPQTPFTQQDFRARRQRSAAPTPDTAAAGKTFGDVWGRRSGGGGGESNPYHDNLDHLDNEDEDEEEESNPLLSPSKSKTSQSPTPQQQPHHNRSSGGLGDAEESRGEETEFQKWFYEHRGDNNRAWKRRRREVGREKRREEARNGTGRGRGVGGGV